MHRKKLMGAALAALGAGLLLGLVLGSCALQVILGLALLAAGVVLFTNC